jgi:hypothetical protein
LKTKINNPEPQINNPLALNFQHPTTSFPVVLGSTSLSERSIEVGGVIRFFKESLELSF